jgi:glycosyltransferase involved in cell wall biosynthesis
MGKRRGPVVLQVLPALGSGGVERGTLEMTAAIVNAGGVAILASSGGRLVGAIEAAGGRHITLPLTSKNPLVMWRNADRLTSLIGAEGVDIVHARSRAPAWSARAAATRAGVHFLTTYHGAYGEGFPFKRRYNAVMASGELVIAISRYIAGLIAARHGTDFARIRVIPRGVDAAMFNPVAIDPARAAKLAATWRLPRDVPVVMLPGRLSRWKGQDVFIDALARLARRDAVGVLVGGGKPALMGALLRRAATCGVGSRLVIAGDCDDMPAALVLADIVVSPATEPEAFGRVVIEAQAMALPVIAADHGGAVETIAEGRTGWRVRPGDAVALAAAIDRALALTRADRATLGGVARAAVLRDYTTTAMQRATLGVYDELLPSGAGFARLMAATATAR